MRHVIPTFHVIGAYSFDMDNNNTCQIVEEEAMASFTRSSTLGAKQVSGGRTTRNSRQFGLYWSAWLGEATEGTKIVPLPAARTPSIGFKPSLQLGTLSAYLPVNSIIITIPRALTR